MRKEIKKAPTIRFRGSTDDWEQRKLGDIIDSYSGGTPSVGNTAYYGGNIPFIRSAEIDNESTELFLTEDGLSNSSAKMVSKGDILYALYGATSGEVGIAKLDGAINQAILAILPHEGYDAQFIMQRLKRSKASIISTYLQGGQGNLSGTIVKNLIINTPSYVEQVRMGEYFFDLDNLIALHQRKLEQQKNLKKYFLQNMFPAKGEKVPRIRFKGFTGDWEKKKIIDVCDYVDYRGKTPSKTNSGIFLVTAKNIKDGYIDYDVSHEYVSENDYDEVMHRGKPRIGDVLITTEAPCGNVAQVNKENIALAQRIIKYRGHDNVIDNTYLKYYLLSPEFQNVLYAKSSGGTVQGIKGSILHQQKVNFSSYEEQLKIGQYFDDLDNLITLHQRKLDQLQTMKKYMLQNMFV